MTCFCSISTSRSETKKIQSAEQTLRIPDQNTKLTAAGWDRGTIEGGTRDMMLNNQQEIIWESVCLGLSYITAPQKCVTWHWLRGNDSECQFSPNETRVSFFGSTWQFLPSLVSGQNWNKSKHAKKENNNNKWYFFKRGNWSFFCFWAGSVSWAATLKFRLQEIKKKSFRLGLYFSQDRSSIMPHFHYTILVPTLLYPTLLSSDRAE